MVTNVDRGATPSKKPSRMERVLRAAIWIMGISTVVPFLAVLFPGSQQHEPRPLGVTHFRQAADFYTVVQFPKSKTRFHASNNENVTWAVYFYKPYCGACKRIRPVVEALGSTVNHTNALRFAALDCTKFRVVCSRIGVDQYPRIRLYQFSERTADGFARETVAEWSGLLLGYEVLAWFKVVQQQGHLPKNVRWPEHDALAAAMLRFKLKGETQVESITTTRPRNPGGYLKDVAAAMRMSLLDAVFKTGGDLSGQRLVALKSYVDALKITFPEAATRQQLALLTQRLGQRSRWSQEAYEAELTEWGARVVDGEDAGAWSWCAPSQAASGGYTCGLWLLFHTMLANADRFNSASTLQAIHSWVAHFFGCTECARHFQELWVTREGVKARSHEEASVWLWKAHNLVNQRLYPTDDKYPTSRKLQWPTLQQCEECYPLAVRNGSANIKISNSTFNEQQYLDGNTWVYLQETFCFQSDTFTCAQFYDPSVSSNAEWNSAFLYVAMAVVVSGFMACVCCVMPPLSPAGRDSYGYKAERKRARYGIARDELRSKSKDENPEIPKQGDPDIIGQAMHPPSVEARALRQRNNTKGHAGLEAEGSGKAAQESSVTPQGCAKSDSKEDKPSKDSSAKES